MHPDGHGWALASTTVAGAGCTAGATISRLARTPGTAISLMATCEPNQEGEARPATVSCSQPVAPAGTRSTCGLPVTRTRSVTRPAAVRTTTCVAGGPTEGRSAKATRIDPGSTGE